MSLVTPVSDLGELAVQNVVLGEARRDPLDGVIGRDIDTGVKFPDIALLGTAPADFGRARSIALYARSSLRSCVTTLLQDVSKCYT